MTPAVLLMSAALGAGTPPVEMFIPSAHHAAEVDRISALLVQRSDEFAPEENLHLAVTLTRAARRHELDPTLLVAVIEVESRFVRRGTSPVGALGLMQLMPSTARSFARSAGVKWRGNQSLFEPETNIEIGAAYLAHLLTRFDGNTEHALAAYCHGPGAIRRSLRADGRLSPRERRYGRRVMKVWRALRGSAAEGLAQS